MNYNSVISIIVPVYQSIDTIKECIESIRGSSYRNLEIILIDDGSTDGSGQLCDVFALKDERIKVLHSRNQGASAARNKGLKIATGSYIGFVDSDDYVHKDMFLILMKLIKKYNADISMCDYSTKKIEECDSEKINEQIWLREDGLNNFFRINGEKDNHGIWNKLVKRSLISNFEFIEDRMNEDVDASYFFYRNAQVIAVTTRKLYCYTKNRKGVTNSPVSLKNKDLLYMWDKVYRDVCIFTPEYRYACLMNRKRANFTLLCQMTINGCEKSEEVLKFKAELKSAVRNDFILLMKWKMPMSRKILLLLMII